MAWYLVKHRDHFISTLRFCIRHIYSAHQIYLRQGPMSNTFLSICRVFISPTCPACLAHLILIDLITQIIFGPVPVAALSKARIFFGPLEHWDRGFESRSMYGCVSAFFCVVLSCVDTGLAMGRSPV